MMAMLESIGQDIRFAVRALRRAPAVAATAVVTLALGVAAAAVVFSVLFSLLVSPLPYRDVDRSVVVSLRGITDVGGWKGRSFFSSAEFEAFRDRSHVLEDLIGARTGTVLFHEDGRSTRVLRGAHVTANAFEFLGVPPLAGRSFTDADGRPGAAMVFMMNHRVWQAEFGGDPAILGRTFVLNGEARTLVGIMPPRFHADNADVWIPFVLGGDWGAGLAVTGRLKPGIDIEAAAADLDAVAQQLAAENPGGNFPDRFTTIVRPYLDTVFGDFKTTLYVLLAAALLLLGIASSNVANLLIARTVSREREVAVRAAIGASRARILRQLGVECVVLAAGAAAVGLLLAFVGLRIVVALIPAGTIPPDTLITMHPAVLGASVTIAVVTTLLCGLVPAIHLIDTDRNPRAAMAGRPGAGRLRAALIVVEVALSVVLLMGAATLVRGFLTLTRVDLGIDPQNVLFVRPWLPPEYDSAEKKNAFSRQLLDRLKALPGVTSAAQSMLVPPLTHDWSDTLIPGKPHAERWETRFELCSEDYFEVLGLRLLRGALFTEADVLGRRLVTVVNQTFADRYFPGEDPLGQRVRFQVLDRPFLDAPHNVYFEIVGVVANHQTWGGAWQIVPQAFLPYSIQGFSWRTFLVKTSVPPESLQRVVRDAIWDVDPQVGISAAGSIEGSLRDFYRDPQFDLAALGAFAAVGLGLVAAGVFSVMAFVVSSRTREIGVRMAIGAMQRQIAAMVIGTALRLIAIGFALGGVAVYALSGTLGAWIPGMTAADPLSLAVVGLVVVLAGLAASGLPALRAARVDPVVVLRVE
jgi:putative ABC transport system permease protein